MSKKVSERVTWVGKIDWELKSFHGNVVLRQEKVQVKKQQKDLSQQEQEESGPSLE